MIDVKFLKEGMKVFSPFFVGGIPPESEWDRYVTEFKITRIINTDLGFINLYLYTPKYPDLIYLTIVDDIPNCLYESRAKAMVKEERRFINVK